MDLELTGKRAFVSGASSGLGRAIALELAAEGCDVVVHGRDKARTEQTADEIAALGVKTAVALGDISETEEADAVAKQTLDALGTVDVCVNNVGGALFKDNPAWDEISPEDWLRSFKVNFMSTLRMTQQFVPGMKEQGWGRIINISSTASQQIWGGLPEYGAPKAALNNFTGNLSKTLGPYGITVNCVMPGIVLTEAVEHWLEELKKQFGWGDDFAENERIYTTEFIPQSIHRLGRPREIAVAVAFLASPLSSYTNGAWLRIDGGSVDLF